MGQTRNVRREECDTFDELPKMFQELHDRCSALEDAVDAIVVKPKKAAKGDNV